MNVLNVENARGLKYGRRNEFPKRRGKGTMKTETLYAILAALIVALLLLFLFTWIYLNSQEEVDLFEKNKNDCYSLSDCDKYGCLAEYSMWRKEATNYLLQEQNCLLRRDSFSEENES